MALYKNCRHVWVEPDGKKHRRELKGVGANNAWCFSDGERVKIDDSVKDVSLVLASNPVAQSAKIVAEVHLAGGLDA